MQDFNQICNEFPNVSRSKISSLLKKNSPSDVRQRLINETLTEDQKVDKIQNEFPFLSKSQILAKLQSNFGNIMNTLEFFRHEFSTNVPQKDDESNIVDDDGNDENYDEDKIVSQEELATIKDLHGYSLSSARNYLTTIFKSIQRGNVDECKKIGIITGKGIHSNSGIPRIKLETLHLAAEFNIFAEVSKHNSGVVIIHPHEKANPSYNDDEYQRFVGKNRYNY